jgi:CubicO group peptidase (beta-lactamase class C family)
MKYSRLFFSIVLCLLFFSVRAQVTDIVKSDGIVNELHRANVGAITFMAKPIPLESYKQTDFLKTFELRDSCDFGIRFFMANSLTNYLHQLAPELNVDELNKNGNFQFTFYVDGNLVYTENLVPGAGGSENKKTRTVMRVPFISTTNEDSWGRFMWSRFMWNGGTEALTGGTHTLIIEIRPYLKWNGIETGDIIAKGEIQLIVPKKAISKKQIAIQKTQSGSGWIISKAAYDKKKIMELNEKIADKTYKNITGIVVIKEGKLLLEEYFNGAERNTLHDTRSVGKSFCSALTGIAIRDGYLKSEDQRLSEFYDLKTYFNHSPKKDSVTLRSLLMMSSAFDGSDMNEDSPGNEEKMYPADNWVSFALNLPMDSAKAIEKNWDYFTAGMILIGDILHKAVPGGLEQYADKNLFQPLGIRRYEWEYTPQKVVNTAGGLKMTALDLAKFGQLYKNDGVWNNQQIIPKTWVENSLSRQIQIPGSENEFYGYLFWNKTYRVNDKNYEVFYSSGNGGNKIFIFKDQPLVIVITATAYNTPYAHSQADRMMQRYLIPAVCTKQ